MIFMFLFLLFIVVFVVIVCDEVLCIWWLLDSVCFWVDCMLVFDIGLVDDMLVLVVVCGV